MCVRCEGYFVFPIFAKTEGEGLVHFVNMKDVSVYPGRQRGEGVLEQEKILSTVAVHQNRTFSYVGLVLVV